MEKMPILVVFSMCLLLIWGVIADRVLAPASVVPTQETLGESQGPTYFAEVDQNGNVLRVIVADQAFIDSGAVGDPSNWVQTWKGGGVRKNYASQGMKYDRTRDGFVRPKQSQNEEFNEETLTWERKEHVQ